MNNLFNFRKSSEKHRQPTGTLWLKRKLNIVIQLVQGISKGVSARMLCRWPLGLLFPGTSISGYY